MSRPVQEHALLTFMKRLIKLLVSNIELVLAAEGVLLIVITINDVFLGNSISIPLILGLLLWVLFSVLLFVTSYNRRLKRRRSNRRRRLKRRS